jgi:hypothetical protein
VRAGVERGRRWAALVMLALTPFGCSRKTQDQRPPGPVVGADSAATSSKPVVPGDASEPSAATSASPAVHGGSAATPRSNASALPAHEKTAGLVEVKREGEPRILAAVRAADHGAHDRVVFEFDGAVPGYHLEYIDKPVRDCGAGDVKPIEGDGWLEVRFYPAHAHTPEGKPTVVTRELRPGLPIVREVERTCDFEAVVTWVIGTASPNRYRAFELSAPPRLVVDIDH